MKAKEIRDLSTDEMQQKLTEMKHELFNLRFQHEIGQLENPSKMKETKRDIARIRTVLNEMALSAKETDN
jgi:large subunit ribosomal protein L29